MTLHVANRLWGQENLEFDVSFVRLLAEHYKAPLGRVDFGKAPEAARAAINRWVAGETRDRIQNLLPEGALDAYTRLVLASAVYFKGAWQVAFNPTNSQPGEFRTKNGPARTSLMSQRGRFRYGHADGVGVAELPYRGGLSMLVVLPDADDGLPGVEAQVAGSYDRWLATLTVRDVDLKIPPWKTVSDAIYLNDPLKELGMQLALSDYADFSGITPRGGIMISLVVQKAFVEVTEEGTEAAAATAVVMVVVSSGGLPPPRPPIPFHADHPFLYLIRDPDTGLVLFIGRVLDPR
jgi:serpin B